jgi:hypothetical protein
MNERMTVAALVMLLVGILAAVFGESRRSA